MKLYMFQCGTIKTKKHLLVNGSVPEQEFEVPVPFFLIKHPKGNILFDTGQALSATGTPVDGDYIPVMTENDHVSVQLARVGLKTTDISHIVLSHLHSDHAGVIEVFSQTICYIQEDELKYGNNHGTRDKYPLKWRLLNGRQQKYHDIFGDGSIQIIFTPGHSPGHQSLLLKLKNHGMIMLTADSVYTEEILNEGVLPGVFYDLDDSIRTIEMIREMRRDGIVIITGHDPHAWSGFKTAPAYYE